MNWTKPPEQWSFLQKVWLVMNIIPAFLGVVFVPGAVPAIVRIVFRKESRKHFTEALK